MDIASILLSYPFLLGVFSFIIGQILMPYIVEMAKKKELIVRPNKRTAHEGGVPNIGGLNIFSSFIIPFLLFSAHDMDYQNMVIIAGMYVMLLIGFFDDMVELKPREKLLGELLVGFILIVVADVRLTNLHGFLFIYEIPFWFSYPLSFFVFLLVVNALNLIDGVDGLASGQGILVCLFFGIYFQLTGDVTLSMMAYTFVGALLIFFIYNVFGSKSRIFMGDSGALVLGYTIYLLVVKFCEYNASPENITSSFIMKSAPIVAISVLAVPLIDTVRVMITRIKKGTSPFRADKNHVHHLLLSMGLTHKQVTFTLLVVSVFFIVLGILLRNVRIEIASAIIIILASMLIILLWRLVDRHNKANQK